MPSHPPRTEPIKKQEELKKREIDLVLAIRNNLPTTKLTKPVENYRKANLSLLKARLHTFKENEFQEKPNNITLEKLEKLTLEWTGKTTEEIINELKKTARPYNLTDRERYGT